MSNQKAVLVSHSMGSQVLFYFFHWVQAKGHGNGGPNWVNENVGSWINISGSMLGALKGLTAVLSGEMKDTAQLNAFAVYGLEKFLAKHERVELFRAMPGISSMLPKGGNAVWGNKTFAPDDRPDQKTSFGTFINFKESNSTHSPRNLTVEESIDYLLEHSDRWYQDQIANSYSHGVAHTRAEVEANELDPRKWINPLESRLPLAPQLKIYCFYGVGKPTERSYFYREDQDPASLLNVTIDTGLTRGEVDHGVILGEGDGTVPLLSNGYMCAKGWHIKRFNPAGAQVKVYEMPHEPDRFSPRGGPNTGEDVFLSLLLVKLQQNFNTFISKSKKQKVPANDQNIFFLSLSLSLLLYFCFFRLKYTCVCIGDHVDILGRSSLNDLILRIAGGKGDQIEENYVSNIREYSAKVQVFEE